MSTQQEILDITITDWNKYFFLLVYTAALKSKDTRTKIGAVIVRDKQVLSTGYNGLPRGICDDINIVPERYDRPEKYKWFEHGERNAIYNCSKYGISTVNTTMFTQGIPCVDCCRGIIQSGITTVIIHKQWNDIFNKNPKWCEDAEYTKKMFNECNVKLDVYDGYLNVIGVNNGQIYNL